MGISFGQTLIANVEFGWLGNLKNVIPFGEHIKPKDKGQNSTSQYMITDIYLYGLTIISKIFFIFNKE